LAVLEVRDLHVSFPTERGAVKAVRGVTFSCHKGKVLAIVGESGSGKSTCASSILGLNAGAEISGEVLFQGEDLLTANAHRLRATRGDRVSIILQDPLSGLHPHHTVGWQIAQAIRAHRPEVSKRRARDWAIASLDRVGLRDPRRIAASYPFQLSGGMKQRALIAMAVVLDPEVLIADEPTSALDITVQAEILELIASLTTQYGMAVILITHDLDVVTKIADDIIVMYAGLICERASRLDLFAHPSHPYTDGLLGSAMKLQGPSGPLNSIPGNPPDPLELPSGCSFRPRCTQATIQCRIDSPQLAPVDSDPSHVCSCWNPIDSVFRPTDRTEA
jgi:peptide/nickel transport system ATP-binding protein